MLRVHDLELVLHEQFGLSDFRSGQREALEELLTGGRLLCVQPTGHGKSLLYQLPAAVLPGLTLVISPLLALMRDQLGHLDTRFGVPAATINSDQTDEENEAARARAVQGSVQILFISPEQLDHVDRFAFLVALPVDLVVVDEAHCISTWGHDFRPAYREIARLVRALHRARPRMRILGLTATADGRVEADVRAQLAPEGERPLVVHRQSMDRPNLHLSTLRVPSPAHKLAVLERIVRTLEAPGLLYCATRDGAELTAAYLAARGLDVVAYHAGLDPERKRALQEAFLGGRYTAVAATNALGMGIDKSDLRYVMHVDIPGSITAYYQEVGRAGRDGRPAHGGLLFDRRDLAIQRHFVRAAQPSPDDFEAVLRVVSGAEVPPPLQTIKRQTGLHPTRVTVVVAELVEQGFLAKKSVAGRQAYRRTGQSGAPVLTRYLNQERVRTRELERITRYAEGEPSCLMAALREALGDREARACGRCSGCLGDAAWTSGIRAADADVQRVERWLLSRPIGVPGRARAKLAPGVALFDGTQRASAFVAFMRARASRPDGQDAALSEEVRERLEAVVRTLLQEHDFRAVVVLPSRTWAQRTETAELVGELVGVRPELDLLRWTDPPEARQGALLNNDQRRHNVRQRMGSAPDAVLPDGDVLLLDDYTGSGATLLEAARVLRELGVEGQVVPLVMARVRWRLGRSGMV